MIRFKFCCHPHAQRVAYVVHPHAQLADEVRVILCDFEVVRRKTFAVRFESLHLVGFLV